MSCMHFQGKFDPEKISSNFFSTKDVINTKMLTAITEMSETEVLATTELRL